MYRFITLVFISFQFCCFSQDWNYIPEKNSSNSKDYEYWHDLAKKAYSDSNYVNLYSSLKRLGMKPLKIYEYLDYGFTHDRNRLCRQILRIENIYEKGTLGKKMSIVQDNNLKWDELCSKCRVVKTAEHQLIKNDIRIDSAQINFGLTTILNLVLKNDQKYRPKIASLLLNKKQENVEFKNLWEKQDKIDHLNIVLIEAIVEEYGYPGLSLVGPDLNGVALMILHHQANLEIREKYIPILEQAVKDGELNSIEFFIDRTERLKMDAKKEEETAPPEN